MAHPIRAKRPGEADPLPQVRAICLSFPEATEKLAWGEPTWRVKDKLFAMFSYHHHGDEHISVWCKARDGVQQSLVESEPTHFFRPPYVGVKGWLGIRLDTNPDWKTVAMFLAEAYRMTAPKKLVAELDGR